MSFYDSFKQEDLADILAAYDNYIGEAAASRAFDTGWTPVCVEEFYENEYQNVWKAGHDFSDFFFEASEMAAAEISAYALALAIDEFYYQFDTYNYKDEITDRAEAVSSLEADILNGKIEELKEYLKNEMRSYGETDSFSMAAKLILAQMEQYQKQRKQAAELSVVNESAELVDQVEISCYADQVLPQTDCSELVEAYESAQFTVPKEWAEVHAKGMGFENLEDFQDSYTYDHVDGWYKQAFHDGVLLGVRLTQSREVGVHFKQSKADLTFSQKLANAKDAVQGKQPTSPMRSALRGI